MAHGEMRHFPTPLDANHHGNNYSKITHNNNSDSINRSMMALLSNNTKGDAAHPVKLIVAAIITFLIIFNNLMNLIILRKVNEIGNRMKMLLISLSVSDISLGLLVCLPGLISGVIGYWPFGTAMCQVVGTANGVAISVSIWTLMAISIERCLVIHKPFIARKKQGNLTIICVVVFIWTSSIVFYISPVFAESDLTYYTYSRDTITCSFKWDSVVYFLIAKFIYPIMSGTVIVCTSLKVNLHLKKIRKTRAGWMRLNRSKRQTSTNSGSQFAFGKNQSILTPCSVHLVCHPASFRNTSPNGNDTDKQMEVPQQMCNCNHSANSSAAQSGERQVNDDAKNPRTINPDVDRNFASDNGELSPGFADTCVNTRASVSSQNSLSDDFGENSPALKYERKAKRLLLLSCMVFFTGISPYMILSLVETVIPGVVLPSWIRFTALWCLNTNSLMNVFVYSAVYKDFKRHLKLVLRCSFLIKTCKVSDSGQSSQNCISQFAPNTIQSSLETSKTTLERNREATDSSLIEDVPCSSWMNRGQRLEPRDDIGLVKKVLSNQNQAQGVNSLKLTVTGLIDLKTGTCDQGITSIFV